MKKPQFTNPRNANAPSQTEDQGALIALNDELTVVENSCTTEPDACVSEFVRIWKEYGGRVSRPIVLASIYAHGQSALTVLDAASKAIDTAKEDRPNRYAVSFLQEAARVLSSKLVDKKPLYELALDAGCWESILSLDGPAKDKESYVIKGLLEADTLHCMPANSVWSVASAITEKSLPEIRIILRRSGPDKERFWIAMRTLVDYDDQEIIPELNRMSNSDTLSQTQRETAKLFAVKLEFQHSRDKLLMVAKKERESKSVLVWTVRRLLWLKTPRSTIHAALSENRATSKSGKAIAAEVDKYLISCESAEAPAEAGMSVDLSMLDRPERERYMDMLREEGLITVMQTYSFHGLVTSAPAEN